MAPRVWWLTAAALSVAVGVALVRSGVADRARRERESLERVSYVARPATTREEDVAAALERLREWARRPEPESEPWTPTLGVARAAAGLMACRARLAARGITPDPEAFVRIRACGGDELLRWYATAEEAWRCSLAERR